MTRSLLELFQSSLLLLDRLVSLRLDGLQLRDHFLVEVFVLLQLLLQLVVELVRFAGGPGLLLGYALDFLLEAFFLLLQVVERLQKLLALLVRQI